MADKIDLEISKYLKKKKESVIIDLVIKDYNKSNFYIALVYNNRIEKFKVLFLPIDVVDINIEEYVCYQFINVNLVNYILETVHNAKDRFRDSSVRDRSNKMISTYYIEIHTHVGEEEYTFKTTKYLPKEWQFLYEIVLILFEHTPNVMNELCRDILAVLDGREDIISYQKSITFDIFKFDLEEEFKNSQLLEVSYLEKVNGKYFGIIHEKLVIIDYINSKNILNLYCNCGYSDDYFYSCLVAIRNHEFKDFYKLMVVDDVRDFDQTNVIARYYLCYGIRNDCFKIIEGDNVSLMPIRKYRDGLVKIIGDNHLELERLIEGI